MNTLGAHEVLELHEVLNESVSALNTINLYRPHAKEQVLRDLMDRHIRALMMEYNGLIQLANHQMVGAAIPARSVVNNLGFEPTYGLRNMDEQDITPANAQNELHDRDVALALLNCHKQSSSFKMKAALEMAHPSLRGTMQHAANSSADLAYEAFQYANMQRYYEVPILHDQTQDHLMHGYVPMPNMNINQVNTNTM
ncbi:spore coat protein [Peribacillus sp. SCS-155]|uniref:spore coat protein n=1 Tax=Peribacillus sedimenti TaxID=3115297 RepID=UPI003906C02C